MTLKLTPAEVERLAILVKADRRIDNLRMAFNRELTPGYKRRIVRVEIVDEPARPTILVPVVSSLVIDVATGESLVDVLESLLRRELGKFDVDVVEPPETADERLRRIHEQIQPQEREGPE